MRFSMLKNEHLTMATRTAKLLFNVTDHLTMLQTAYDGATGQGTHAEMNAIVQFLQAINYNHNNFPNYVLEIECLSKPCCKNCSAVLGLLGVHKHLAVLVYRGSWSNTGDLRRVENRWRRSLLWL
jgi:hypothetical protein